MITTDALELGIDIGALDAAVSVTFPGTVASLRQQWGRAGRRGRGLAVYVAGEDALDQFFCRHPDEFLDRPVEAAILDHESPEIHLQHVRCAAAEGPLDDADREFLGPRLRGYAERLETLGELRERNGTFVPRRPQEYPAAEVSLRSSSGDSFAVVDTSSGEVDRDDRGGARVRHRARGRGLPAHGALLRGRRRSTSTRARRWSARSRATGSPSPGRRPRPRSSGCSTAARRSA